MHRFLERIICRSSQGLSRLLDGQVPKLSNQQFDYAAQLRAAFERLYIPEGQDVLPSEAVWLRNMNRLKDLVLGGDLETFLRWDVIQDTMFVPLCSYVFKEFYYLRRRSDWLSRWRPAIQEASTGYPPPFPFYPASSGNLIHHAYHAAVFEELTGLKLHEMDFVLEFGGGYGSMCRLFHQLGFRGRYVILDLAPFSHLQEYFLRSIGLEVLDTANFAHSQTGIWCGSDFRELETTLPKNSHTSKSMFVATWSLSETPVRTRSIVMAYCRPFSAYLIAYQERFGELDNLKYFAELQTIWRDIHWIDLSIGHIRGSRYLLGTTSTTPQVRNSSHIV